MKNNNGQKEAFFRLNAYIYLIEWQKQPREVFCKKGVVRNLSKFTVKHLCQSLFFNKVGFYMITALRHERFKSTFLILYSELILVDFNFWFWANSHKKRHSWLHPIKNKKSRNARIRCEICSKLTIKTPKGRHWRPSGIFIINFEDTSRLFQLVLLSTLNK